MGPKNLGINGKLCGHFKYGEVSSVTLFYIRPFIGVIHPLKTKKIAVCKCGSFSNWAFFKRKNRSFS